jgi:hypothetical protein
MPRRSRRIEDSDSSSPAPAPNPPQRGRPRGGRRARHQITQIPHQGDQEEIDIVVSEISVSILYVT